MNYVIECFVRLEFCNSLYPKELAVFFPSYFVDHHQEIYYKKNFVGGKLW
jgi:hypothetical protein